MTKKRVVICSDLHSGHRVGLTPPSYQSAIPGKEYLLIQREMWERYDSILESLQPIDIGIWNADLIDGKGRRSGGSELITSDTNKQIEMATVSIKHAKAQKNMLTYGTPYHVGEQDDSEKIIANELKATIKSHLFLDIEGVNFDIKHEPASKGQLPHTRGGAIGRDWLANTEWTVDGEQPTADVIIRSHVHSFHFTGSADWLGMTTPALQGQGSKFGARRCSGRVHWGLIHFDIEDGEYKWYPHVVVLESQKQSLIKL